MTLPSIYLLPSMYITAGGQDFAIPPDVTVVRIATQEEPAYPDFLEKRVQLIFKAEEPAGVSLFRNDLGSWLLANWHVAFLKRETDDEGRVLVAPPRRHDTSEIILLKPGKHLLIVGREEIQLVIPPPNVTVLKGGIDVYSFISSLEPVKH